MLGLHRDDPDGAPDRQELGFTSNSPGCVYRNTRGYFNLTPLASTTYRNRDADLEKTARSYLINTLAQFLNNLI